MNNITYVPGLINLTPHDVQIWDGERLIHRIPAEETSARCKENVKPTGEFVKIPLVELSYAEVDGLPEEKSNVIYIVSVLVAQQFPNRRDLLVPYDLVRNENGSIIGCRKLARII